LENAGVKPDDIYVVGKAYSSHPLIANELKRRGYHIDDDTLFDSKEDQPYDSILEEHIISSCNSLLTGMNNKTKGLIIDDGGKAIKLLHKSYPDKAKYFHCVEQTSGGARVVELLTLKCPVVNVARSEAKTVHESPFIAKSMVHEFISSLERWDCANIYLPKSKNVLLLGFGFIGENVAEELRYHGFTLTIYDPDKNKLLKASLKGFMISGDVDIIYKNADIIVGTTGTQVIPEKDLEKLRPGVFLVNMASTDTEFSAWNLRPLGKVVHQHILASDTQYISNKIPLPWRSLYKVNLLTKYIYLVNGGFPTDFSGKVNPIPANNIQLTTALLLRGALQSVNTRSPGFFDLESITQEEIIKEYDRL